MTFPFDTPLAPRSPSPSNRSARIHSLAKALGVPVRPSFAPNKRRLEAARVLFVQSGAGSVTDGPALREEYEHLALPENRDQALLAYDKAITSLMLPIHGDLGDIRRKVYESARVLGLNTSSAERERVRQQNN